MSTTALPDPTNLDAVRAWLADRASDVDAVRAWAVRLLADLEPVGPVPVLGAPSWLALADTDPRKLAAAIGPAVAHLVETTPEATAARLRGELDEFATAWRRACVEVSHDVSRAWTDLGYSIGPSHAELVRRRNTYRCRHCRTEFSGTTACPNGCEDQPHTKREAA